MAGDILIDISGALEVRKNLHAATSSINRGVSNAVNQVGLLLLRESKLRAPHDVGDMVRSAVYQRRGDTGFVVFRSEYAAIVHEDPRANPKVKTVTHGQDYNVRHADDIALGRKYWYKNKMRKYHTRRPQESWKFLEGPARENVPQFTAIVVNEVKAAIERGA